jgi:methyl-accepting chemotaxis protein
VLHGINVVKTLIVFLFLSFIVSFCELYTFAASNQASKKMKKFNLFLIAASFGLFVACNNAPAEEVMDDATEMTEEVVEEVTETVEEVADSTMEAMEEVTEEVTEAVEGHSAH